MIAKSPTPIEAAKSEFLEVSTNKPRPWPVETASWVGPGEIPTSKASFIDYVLECQGLGRKTSATVFVTSNSNYQLYMDGAFVGRGPAPGQPALSFYDTWTVDLQAGGRHRMAVRVFHEGNENFSAQGFDFGQPGLLLAVQAGDSILVQTGADCRCRVSPEYSPLAEPLSRWGNFRSHWRKSRVDAWMEPGFDLAGWSAVEVLGRAVNGSFCKRLVHRGIPALTEDYLEAEDLTAVSGQGGTVTIDGLVVHGLEEARQPRSVQVEPGAPYSAPELTWDLGSVRTGHPRLELDGAACVVELACGESYDTLRTDVLHCEDGKTEWESFHRRAFRFLKLRFIGLEGAVAIRKLGLIETVFPYHSDGSLELGNEATDRIVAVTRRTQLACSSHHYEDCPWREQALWIVDARIMALANAYLYGNHDLTAKNLRQCFALQRDDGSVAACGPRPAQFYFLDFMLHLAPMLWEHFQISGDVALVKELLPKLDKVHRFLLQWANQDGLLDNTRAKPGEADVFFDWDRGLARKGCTTILNALYVLHLEATIKLLEAGGQPEKAPGLKALQESVRQASHQAFFDSRLKLYQQGSTVTNKGFGPSMMANLLALDAKFPEPSEIPAIYDKVCLGDELPRPRTPSPYLSAFSVMHRLGRQELVLDWMQRYWGGMLQRGATTWWEVFDEGQPDWAYPHPFLGQTPTSGRGDVPVSHCHGWSTIPGFAVPRYLLGIDLGQIYRKQIVWEASTPALFPELNYRVQTPAGPFHLKLQRDGDRYEPTVLDSPYPFIHKQTP